MISDNARSNLEEAKRIFSLQGMPVDDFAKAAVEGTILGSMGRTVLLAQQSLDRLAITFPGTPRIAPLHLQVKHWEAVFSSEIELFFHAAKASQEQQLVFRAGQMLDANLALRQIFESAQSSIDIADQYLGTRLFHLLSAKRDGVAVRILSGEVKKADLQTAKDFKCQYDNFELREQTVGMHDRFIILDHAIVYSVGHSLKDLGSKDTVLNKAPDSRSIIKLFQERWEAAEIRI